MGIWCSPCRVTICAIVNTSKHGLLSHGAMVIWNPMLGWSNKTSTPPCPGPKIHSKWVSYSDMERDERATMCMCLRRRKENNVFVFVTIQFARQPVLGITFITFYNWCLKTRQLTWQFTLWNFQLVFPPPISGGQKWTNGGTNGPMDP